MTAKVHKGQKQEAPGPLPTVQAHLCPAFLDLQYEGLLPDRLLELLSDVKTKGDSWLSLCCPAWIPPGLTALPKDCESTMTMFCHHSIWACMNHGGSEHKFCDVGP